MMRGDRCGVWLTWLVLACVAGCQSAPGGPAVESAAHQHGATIVLANDEQDVYYPVPFVSPPNLQVKSAFDDCSIIEQKPDHFRLKNPNMFSREVVWEARGIPISSAPPAPNMVLAPARNGGPGADFTNGTR
jgi:hypothetical protein